MFLCQPLRTLVFVAYTKIRMYTQLCLFDKCQILMSCSKFYLSYPLVLLDFSLTVKAATLILISGYGSAISSAKEGKSGFIYNLVKN